MVTAIYLAFALYALAGTAFGVLFVSRGIERVDPAARGAPWTFRLLLLPGVVALWPIMARKWLRTRIEGKVS